LGLKLGISRRKPKPQVRRVSGAMVSSHKSASCVRSSPASHLSYRDIQQSLGTIETMASRGDAQGDLALVVAFTKLLDPGSVAREGEVSLTQSSASTVQQATNWLNQLQRGNTILPQDVRAAFLSASQELAGQYRQSFDARRSEYGAIAEDYGLDANRITIGGPAAATGEPSIDDLLNQYGD